MTISLTHQLTKWESKKLNLKVVIKSFVCCNHKKIDDVLNHLLTTPSRTNSTNTSCTEVYIITSTNAAKTACNRITYRCNNIDIGGFIKQNLGNGFSTNNALSNDMIVGDNFDSVLKKRGPPSEKARDWFAAREYSNPNKLYVIYCTATLQ